MVLEQEALFTTATFKFNYRVNTGVINNINYGPVPFRYKASHIVNAGSP